METEEFSNPIGPAGGQESDDEGDDATPLTNADFRKLMMTPAPGSQTGTHSDFKKPKMKISLDSEAMKERKKKKMYYAKLKKLQEEREKELQEKYRDRAKERRDGSEGGAEGEPEEDVSTTADYRAVAPDKQPDNFGERRKQIIQESKYLGGDMEHTHLVKGLDYALLEKVRAEISSKETVEEELEKSVAAPEKEKPKDAEGDIQFKTKMGRNIFRQLVKSQTKKVERNELFLPRRMCYVIDLDDEFGDSDIPTTVIRSKADCPSLESATTLSTNDIVINKLTEILGYLRTGRKERRRLKREKAKQRDDDHQEVKDKNQDDSIYGEIGEYEMAGPGKEGRRKERSRGEDRRAKQRDDDRKQRRSGKYFDRSVKEEGGEDRGPSASAKELVKSINDRFSSQKGWPAEAPPLEQEGQAEQPPGKEERSLAKMKKKLEINSYAECYPGMAETFDAIDDSDDEADYTKMDQGNKKGPVSRWDFETQEEYSSYMDKKEAMPKAAFQYGVKMSDGRRTRRVGPKDEKKELEKEWQKIQNIITKRKGPEGGDKGGQWKKPKY